MSEKKILTAPSVLSADFSNLSKGLELIKKADAEWIHLDVMDGSFVPVITFGPKMVKDIRAVTDLVLDVHLMIDNPENQIDAFIDAGSDYITFHYEAGMHSHRIIQKIKQAGIKAGISIIPSTPVAQIRELLPYLDLVLIMTVNPGFGGQSIIPTCVEKIKKLDEIRKEFNYNFLLSVDGGINRKTSGNVIKAGVDVLVSGSAFFHAEDPVEELAAIRKG